MTIKHLVFSGGAYKGFYIVGALDYLIDNKFLKLDDIETIYGTSVGGIIGLALCLKIEMKVLREYIIKKNWRKYFDFSINSVLNILQKKGLLDKTFMVGIFKTLFRKAGININPTFMDIYNHSGINLNIFATNMTTFKLEQFSHKTHPDMMVLDAIYMSSSLPFIFPPKLINNKHYIDAFAVNNCPCNIFENDLQNTICLNVAENNITLDNSENFLNYIMKVFSSYRDYNYDNNTKRFKPGIIINLYYDCSPIDFDLEKKTLSDIFIAGYNTANTYFKNNPIKKNN